MADRKPQAYATLIGDLVRSRGSRDRAALHRRLTAALTTVAEQVTAVEAPAVTFADEVQGRFAEVGQALHAALLLRLELLPTADLRFGIGWGAVTVLDPERNTQDGPGWWSARSAIETTERLAEQPAFRSLRTTYEPGETGGPAPEPVNAALLCRDHLLGSLDERSTRILKGLMDQRTRASIAADEGISPSAVSQRAQRDGLDVVLRAGEWLREVR